MVRTVKDKASINTSIIDGTANANDRGQQMAQVLVAPWPEWNDADINTEKWESKTTVSSEKQKSISHNASLATDDGFESPLDRVCMPASIPVYNWKRSAYVIPRCKILPENESPLELDLVSTNEHILHSEVMRHIVTSVMSLYHLAAIKPFDDVPGESYVPNGGSYWKPWNHVYSMCKAGRGTTHKPMINKSCKYVVRLYFLGKWRRITVDDFLPLDEHDRILLPTSPTNELWPILVAKAILRIAALTWTPSREVVDMNAITCFTGWLMLNVECKRVPAKDVWLVCQKALMNEAEDGARYEEEPKPVDAYNIGPLLGGGDRRNHLTHAMCNEMEESWGTVAVFANMAAIDEILEDEVAEIGPCVGHQVLFSEARIMRVGDDGGPLPLWKTFRWKKWALKTGIIQPDHLVNVKSLRVFAPLKKWVVLDDETLILRFYEMKALQIEEEERREEEERVRELQAKTKKGNKKSAKKSSEGTKASTKKSGTESSGKSKKTDKMKSAASKSSSGKSKIKKEEVEVRENTDPWINFNVYSSYVNSIQLFFRASSFKYQKSTSDFLSFVQEHGKESSTKKENEVKILAKTSNPVKQPLNQPQISTTKYKQRRIADYFYVVSDTPTSKKMFITVSVVPPSSIAEQQAVLLQHPVAHSGKQPFSLTVLDISEALKPSQAQCRSSITTVGTKSTIIQFDEGICGVRMWVSLPPRHFIQIVSQVDFKLGTYEVCHELLGKPSVSQVLYGRRVFDAFARVKRCVPGSPEHVQALAAYHASYLPDSLASNFSSTRSVVKFTTNMRSTCEQVCVRLLRDRLKDDFDRFYTALRELQELMLAPDYGMEALLALDPEMYEKIIAREEELARPPEELLGESQDTEDTVLDHTADTETKAKNKGNAGKGDKKRKASKSSGDRKSSGDEKKGTKKNSLKLIGAEVSKNTASNQIPHILFDRQIASGIEVISKIVQLQPNWAHYYPFRGDLKERIAYRDYEGTAATSLAADWFPILRIVLNVDHDTPTVNSIFFSSSAALSFVHIVNNDTQMEVTQLVANISTNNFVRNTLGYTYFAYGFCDNIQIKEHSYKLHVVAAEHGNLLHRCQKLGPVTETCISESTPPPTPATPLKVQQVYGHYIPNRRNKVFQCILTVRCSQVLTIRVSTNNPKADILVKILEDEDENGESKLVHERRFSGKATLLSLYFSVDVKEGSQEQTQKVFLIEGWLATDEGWKLSASEQSLVVGIKERVQKDLLVFHKKESVVKTNCETIRRTSSFVKCLPQSVDIIPAAAYWCVQVIIDADLEKTITLELNRRKEQEIRHLKEEWERSEPGRHIRAMKERQKLLEKRDEENRQLGISFEKTKLYQSFQLKESSICPEQRNVWKLVAEDYGMEQEEMRAQERKAFDEILNETAAKRALICQKQKEAMAILKRHLAETEAASRGLLESGYKLRESCFQHVAAKTSAEGKKGAVGAKGGKPGKVGKKK